MPGETVAQRLMKKQGWSQGQGLGRDKQGIVDPLKASMKFDTAGIGHDLAKEFTDNWWDLAYKKAANAFEVGESKDGNVEMKKAKKRDKKDEKREAKKGLYGRFTKSATLANGKLVEEQNKGKGEDSDHDTDVIKFERLTDEELFKACGGLTAHKGARHGINMSSKAKRIEEMDKKFLDVQGQQVNGNVNHSCDSEEKKKKKKKRKRSSSESADVKCTETANDHVKRKKKKSKKSCKDI